MKPLKELVTARDVKDSGAEDTAIKALQKAFEIQRKAFLTHPAPEIKERRAHLEALAGMMLTNRDKIRAALKEDFAIHHALFTDVIEILGVAGRAGYALSQLDKWMQDEEREIDPAMFGTGKAFIRHQPKGVIGNIVPWNFPLDLSIGPLVEILAAGNRAIIKPSDYTPACGELVREMIAATFNADHVTTALGGIELAQFFPTLPWNHLLYTGSPAIGREIMKAAAQNLVPVTLELGGKCPAIFMNDGVNRIAVGNALGTKMVKNGQMCISVDYCLVPRKQVGKFITLAQEHFQQNLPNYSRSEDCTGIISRRHFLRLQDLLQQARDAGSKVVELETDGMTDAASGRMPLVLVINPNEQLDLMKEEIFGPILPVVAYDTLEEAIAYVNAAERPLGLYVFGGQRAETDRVLAQTTSGGACVNACAIQGALASLGFGGSGMSGMGRHHGIDGFREFSNPRGVFVRGQNDLIDAFCPPYGETLRAITTAAYHQAMGGS
jgi:coniferyl-aldehyde dehydrogenase